MSTWTIGTNHWYIPSEENAFDNWLEGAPSPSQREEILKNVAAERKAWKPSQEALDLVETLRTYTGKTVRLEWWESIMNLLEDEGPYPLTAKICDVVVKKDGDFLQAYLVLSDVSLEPTEDGFSPMCYLSAKDPTCYFATVNGLYKVTEIIK